MSFRFFHIAIFILLAYSLQAQQVALKKDMDFIQLSKDEAVKMLKASKDTPFESIQNESFHKDYNRNDNPSFDEVIWLKIPVKNLTSEKQKFYIYSRLPFFQLYQPNSSGYTIKKNGYHESLKNRTNKESFNFLSFTLNPEEESEIFLRIQNGKIFRNFSKPVIGGSLFYYKQQKLIAQYNRPGSIFSIVYFSAVSVIFFFILMLFVYLKERVYLYYLGYLFFQILYAQFVFFRSPIDFLNPGVLYPSLSGYLPEPLQFIFIGFYIFFIKKLMDIKTNSLIGKSMKSFAWLCYAYAGLALLFLILWPTPKTNALLFNISRGIALPVNLLFIIWIIKEVKHPLMNYFIGAHLFFFTGAVFATLAFTLKLAGNPHSLLYFENSYNTIFQAGLLGEVICFSFALAMRIRFMQQEKEKNALDYIHQLRENKRIQENMNKALDLKVEEKTQELIEVYSAIEKQREKELKLEFNQKIKEMETLALRSQMNPHFIFNSLNAIKFLMMTEKKDQAIHYLDEFSKLLRSVLQNSKRDTVSVADEIAMTKLYLSMEKERLGSEYDFEVLQQNDRTLDNLPIPSLLLQPIIENAIWHGLAPSPKTKKKLKISFEKGTPFKITITDNGVGRNSKKKLKVNNSVIHQPMGLQITHDRLKLFNQIKDLNIDMKIFDLEEAGQAQGTQVVFIYSQKEVND